MNSIVADKQLRLISAADIVMAAIEACAGVAPPRRSQAIGEATHATEHECVVRTPAQGRRFSLPVTYSAVAHWYSKASTSHPLRICLR